jgi:NADH-quinone oxidoreductase subunit J
MTHTIFFYCFAALTLAGAILTVTMRSAIHCAIALIASLAGVAGLYLLQHAEFLFAVQLVLYIGGIMVLFLFVIMLVNLDAAARQRQFHRQWLLAGIGGVLTGAGFLWFLIDGVRRVKLPAPAQPASNEGNVQLLADVLFREYLVPFEVASLLLLVAIVGSVIMAKKNA